MRYFPFSKRRFTLFCLVVIANWFKCWGFQTQPGGRERQRERVAVEDSLYSNRRNMILSVPTTVLSSGAVIGFILSSNSVDAAASFFEQKERRQLDLCIVSILRLQYWALSVASRLQNDDATEEERKKAYLEARLGAKAAVTGKVGGGANGRVFNLLSMQIKDCLEDIQWYGKSKKIDSLKEDLLESLASVVEFDGLETTLDPSPRSALTLSMYNRQKSVFVARTLAERVAPLSQELVGSFDVGMKKRCEGYVRDYYANELPPVAKVPLE
jgi:hypothetical protein